MGRIQIFKGRKYDAGNPMQTIANTTTASHIQYNAYGYTKLLIQGPYSSGFNGAYFDIHTHGYHLGQGYRMYSPALTRFTSPDSLSPFGRGGINTYAYCNGDPVNRIDPHGTAGIFTSVLKWIDKHASRKPPKVDMTLPRRRAQRFGEIYEASIIAYDRKMKENAISNLMSVSALEPDLLDNVAKYLSPGDLEGATRHLGRYHSLSQWTQRVSDRAYLKHHSNVLNGNLSYRTDGRLDHLAIGRLERLEGHILKANRPYTLADSRPFASPEIQLELSIERANELRSELQRLP